jgi:hypothetical protein
MRAVGEFSEINQDIENFKQVNNNELIDVSDDDESESDCESDSGSGSSGSSGSESDSDSDSRSESDDEDLNNTKKIIIGGNIESQTIEHLTGPDVKVIELSHPLYPSQNGNTLDSQDNDNDDDDDYDDDDEDDDEEDDENDEDSSETGNHNNIVNIEDVTSTLNGVEYLEKLDTSVHKVNEVNEVNIEYENISEIVNKNVNLKTDEISIKTVFKNKVSDMAQEFNGLNVQSLRQLYKQRLLIEGKNMSEAVINKLSKKELVKNLQQ